MQGLLDSIADDVWLQDSRRRLVRRGCMIIYVGKKRRNENWKWKISEKVFWGKRSFDTGIFQLQLLFVDEICEADIR